MNPTGESASDRPTEAAQPLPVPTVGELARLGPERAGRYVGELSDAIADAMVDAAPAAMRRRVAQMDALADAHHLYYSEQSKHIQDAEIARLEDDVERMELDAFAARFERGARP